MQKKGYPKHFFYFLFYRKYLFSINFLRKAEIDLNLELYVMFSIRNYAQKSVKVYDFPQSFGENEEHLPMKRRHSNEEGINQGCQYRILTLMYQKNRYLV